MSLRREVIGDCTLYLGDCLELLPTLDHVDVVLTDPVWPNAPDGMFPGVDPYALFRQFCAALPKDLRQLVICLRNDSDPRILRYVPKRLAFQQVAWCQYVMPGYLGRVLGGNECAYVYGTPVKRQPGRMVVPSVSPKAQPSDRPPNGHPCSRALIHQVWLANWFSDEGETVCDPFMGSATAGEACMQLGRKFVGIEKDERYFEIACERLQAALGRPNLFVRRQEPVQEALAV